MPRPHFSIRSVNILTAEIALHDYEDAEHKLPPSENPYAPNPQYASRWDRLPRLAQDQTRGNRLPRRENSPAPRARSPSSPARPRPTARRGRGRPFRVAPSSVHIPERVLSEDSGSADDEPPLAAARAPAPVAPPAPRQAAPRPPPPGSPRQRLERSWCEACSAVGAAAVTIAPGRGDDIPVLEPGFRYLENGYMLGDGVAPPEEGFLVSCACGAVCMDAEACQCQEVAALAEEEDRRTFAYDSGKLFKFDRQFGALVMECNKGCLCGKLCPNRVAQLPRDVPVQIFKTEGRGWGVRSPNDIPEGKVLGIYTGKLITRAHAITISVDSLNRSYVFDLDALEDTEDFEDASKFSIDAYRQGNWTRFVNHSCSPNVEVYPVAWDTHPGTNRFYLAFVAAKIIPANTELTIDYDPKAARDTKGKRRQRNGEKQCRCGAPGCRGYIAV